MDMVPVCFAAATNFSFSPRMRSAAASKSTSNGGVEVLVAAAALVEVVVAIVISFTVIACWPSAARSLATLAQLELTMLLMTNATHFARRFEAINPQCRCATSSMKEGYYVQLSPPCSVGVVVTRHASHAVRVDETSVDLRHRAALGGGQFGCRRDRLRDRLRRCPEPSFDLR